MTSCFRATASGLVARSPLTAGMVAAVSLVAVACAPAQQTSTKTTDDRDLGSKQAIATLAARVSDPSTASVCGALIRGEDSLSPTVDIAHGPVVDGIPRLCTQLDELGFVATKKDDGDFEPPEMCDDNMGKVDIGCFRSCLELSNEFALDDQSIEDWRSDADFCAQSCEIGCDGTVGF